MSKTTPAPTPAVQPSQGSAVPPFVIEYAPVIYMDKEEQYMPSDLQAQIDHTTPEVKFTKLTEIPSPLTLSNLDSLNAHGGATVYLTSNDDITRNPAWLKGVKPDASGLTKDATACAIIVVDQGDGTVDAFYFYFFAYNQGNTVIGMEFGDHVGDWEHIMVRFENSKPDQVWYSQHSSGEAFEYSVVEKHNGIRPVGYSARGSHAHYAIPGSHDHTLPNFNLPDGPVEDHTSRGTLWDPVLNCFTYRYDIATKAFIAYNGHDPTGWLRFQGQWGDAQYPKSDHRQVELFGDPKLGKFVAGPNGPQFKNLVRKKVWPDSLKNGMVRKILTV